MDETIMTETAAPEETIPEAQTVNTEAPEQEATPETQPQAEGEAQPEEEQPTGEAEKDPAPAFTIPVKYDKQYRELTPDEARAYAQKGMRYEALEPQLSKIRFVARQSGMSVESVLDGVYQASEAAARKKMLDKVGGDEQLADVLMEAWRVKNKAAYDDMLTAEAKAAETEAEDNNKRLADEFTELRREFPEIARIEDVPKAVMQAAVRSGRDLLSEYLLHTHKESKRVAQAEAQQAAAAKAATGSQTGGEPPAENPEITAMLSGVWR